MRSAGGLPEGRSRRKILRGGPEQARRFARNIESSKDHGAYVDPALGKQTIADYARRWLASVQGSLKPKTTVSYQSLIDSRVVPALGRRHLATLKPSDVQAWVSSMQGEGLSASRIRQAHVTLKQILDAAVRDGAVGRNAALGVKLPRLEQREAAYFAPEVVESIAAAHPKPYDLLVRVLGTLGLRFGEAAGLQRRHIDLMRRRIRIEQSLAEVRGGLVIGSTKTHSTRGVPLSPALTDAMQAHLRLVGTEPDAIVFTSPEGSWLRYHNFHRRIWHPVLDRLGLPAVGLHVLRHSAAARMISAGASAKAVQNILGHRSVAFMLTVYAHLFDDDLDDLAARLDTENPRRACRKRVVQRFMRQFRSGP